MVKPKLLRQVILAFTLIVSISVVAYFGPHWWGYLLYVRQVRSLQSQCLNYLAPPDQIVYDNDPADRQRLLAIGPEYRAFNDWSVFHVPAVWHDFRGAYDCPDGTAFVHARTSPAGHQRLVAVDIIPIRQNAIALRGSAIDLVPRFDVRKLEGCRRSMGRASDEWVAKPKAFVRIFSGQPDSNDKSRFTIPADFGEGIVSIHCQLQDDDTVRIERR